MASSRRRLLLASTAAATAALAGCGGGELSGAATPPPTAFEVTAADGETVERRYTGVGSQDLSKFRVVLEVTGESDGTYDLVAVTDDTAWSRDGRYVLNQSALGLSAPLAVPNLTVTLQYDDGDWRTIVRTDPAD